MQQKSILCQPLLSEGQVGQSAFALGRELDFDLIFESSTFADEQRTFFPCSQSYNETVSEILGQKNSLCNGLYNVRLIDKNMSL